MKGIVTWGVPRIPNHQSKPSGEFFHQLGWERVMNLYLLWKWFSVVVVTVVFFLCLCRFFSKSATCHLFRCVFFGRSVVESSPQFGSFFTSGSEFCELQVAQVLEGSSAIMIYNDYIMIIYEFFEVHWL